MIEAVPPDAKPRKKVVVAAKPVDGGQGVAGGPAPADGGNAGATKPAGGNPGKTKPEGNGPVTTPGREGEGAAAPADTVKAGQEAPPADAKAKTPAKKEQKPPEEDPELPS